MPATSFLRNQKLAASTALSGLTLFTAVNANAMPRSFYDDRREAQVQLAQEISDPVDPAQKNYHTNPGPELILTWDNNYNPNQTYYDRRDRANELGVKLNLHLDLSEENGGSIGDFFKRGAELAEASVELNALNARLRLGVVSDIGSRLWKDGVPLFSPIVSGDNHSADLRLTRQLGVTLDYQDYILEGRTGPQLALSASMTGSLNPLRWSFPNDTDRGDDGLTTGVLPPSFTANAGLVWDLPMLGEATASGGIVSLQKGDRTETSEFRFNAYASLKRTLTKNFSVKAAGEVTEQVDLNGVEGRSATTASGVAFIEGIFDASRVVGDSWFGAYVGATASSRTETGRAMPDTMDAFNVVTARPGTSLGLSAGADAKFRIGQTTYMGLGLDYEYGHNSEAGKTHSGILHGRLSF